MEMVKILVETGADVNYRAIDPEEFALSEAIYCENQDIFKIIWKHLLHQNGKQ